MRMKQVLLTMLSLIFVFVVAACSNGTGGTPANSGNSSPTQEPVAANNNNPEEEEATDEGNGNPNATPEMDFDLGGRTIKVVSWWDMTIPEDNPDNIQRKANLEALMEKHNFNIEYVPIDYGEYQTKVVASLMAGEPIGDIVRLGKTYTVPTLVKQDLLWPLDDYVNNDNAFNTKVTKELYTFEGKGYGFTDDKANHISGVFYNKTLMNQLGLKPLQEYVDEDNWNWDTFIEVAKEANKDTNNDGKLDVWGLANRGLLEQSLYANEAALTLGDQQNLDDPKTLEALNFVSRLATEQVSRPTEGGDWTEPSQFFRQGNTLMYAGAMYEVSGIKTDMADYDIGFVPFPKGPSATAYHSGEALYQALTIPKSVDNPEQLMYIWEKINDIESMYDYPSQATLESNFTDEADINNARMAQDGLIVLDHNTFPSLPYWDFEAELTSGTSVSTVVEKYKASFQAAIDEIYGQ
ncbi:ABC transporter substrate-binding protein [Paenibacillus montaniterrae]|uniref:ABC transporter substrate-binding protein n=1 Tax=Paenibacillus montaniterrae TaxID=429341 RepID=A0A920CZR8_9BACL|nr:extracellular solute-binding protein [Paenibacillus montaniterrae]GIP17259.1 ABC transporter substrate-binding protein [Paenibacillus montaniterrae]